jgi:UbiD family decarboxylase
MAQGIRDFVAAYEQAFPGEVVHVTDPVTTEFDVMALVLEYERRRRWPILLFEKVTGADMPIIANVVASRTALAWALGVPEARLAQEYARRIKETVEPKLVTGAPFHERVLTGPALDLGRLPIPTYFPGDAGRYLTAGMLVARDPETGVETEGYHRFQVKGRDRMGVSLHSRRRMFEYQRRAEARGQALPCAVALGLHPLVSMGSLAYPPAEVGKFEVVGGLFGEPLEVAPCTAIDLTVPAAAEIVIEGEILPGRVPSASSPATSRAARPSTSSRRRPSRCGRARGSSPSAPAGRATTSRPWPSCARPRSGTRSGG